MNKFIERVYVVATVEWVGGHRGARVRERGESSMESQTVVGRARHGRKGERRGPKRV